MIDDSESNDADNDHCYLNDDDDDNAFHTYLLIDCHDSNNMMTITMRLVIYNSYHNTSIDLYLYYHHYRYHPQHKHYHYCKLYCMSGGESEGG